jgi:hypothetical protein
LGNEFYKIAPVVLSDEALLKKPVRKKVVVVKMHKTSKGGKNQKPSNEDKSPEKSRKD